MEFITNKSIWKYEQHEILHSLKIKVFVLFKCIALKKNLKFETYFC